MNNFLPWLFQKCVVDLWGSHSSDPTYDGDSLQGSFSSGKSVASIVVAALVDQGHLNYDKKVSMSGVTNPRISQSTEKEMTEMHQGYEDISMSSILTS